MLFSFFVLPFLLFLGAATLHLPTLSSTVPVSSPSSDRFCKKRRDIFKNLPCTKQCKPMEEKPGHGGPWSYAQRGAGRIRACRKRLAAGGQKGRGGSEVAEDLPLFVPVHLGGPLVHPLGPYFLFGFCCRWTQVQAALFKGILFAGFSHLKERRADRGSQGRLMLSY